MQKRNIILTGGTSDLPGSIEIAQRLFETNIRLGTPTKIGGLSEDIGGPSFFLMFRSFDTLPKKIKEES